MLGAVVDLNLSVQCGDMRLVAELAPLKFVYIISVHITACLEVSSFPVSESFIGYQAIDSFD